ncbi:MAG: DUF2213 domain-containing protein [Rhodobacteraceae bacterium]|nr:DUF2213 domain-containing protein [Paracoccaceae bacterium]
MQYNYSSTPSPDNWKRDDNGFLRTRARLLSTEPMEYGAHEIPTVAAAAGLPSDAVLKIQVPLEELSDPEAIRSLEGMPVVAYDHAWADPDDMGAFRQVGQVAGTPQVSDGFLMGELVITDAATIAAIMKRELVDVSSAYNAVFDLTPTDGSLCHGLQRKLRYNHIALLEPGDGRAGSDVRVLNKGSLPKMADLTSVRLGNGQPINIETASLHVFNAAADEAEKEKTENAEASSGTLEEKIKELAAANELVAKLTKDLEKTQADLTAAMSPASQEADMDQMINERDEQATALVNAGAVEDKEKAFNSLKGLRGHSARLLVVSNVRAMNKQDPLSDDRAKDEQFVHGAYSAVVDAAPATQAAPTVNGSGIVATQIQNAGTKSVERSPSERLFGTPKKGA